MLDDLCALCTHESDSRVADPMGKVDGALDAERARSTGGGESRVAARGDRQVHVRAVCAEGVLCEVGDAARLEGLRGLNGLGEESQHSSACGSS